jgi:hypothetical protein
MTLFFTVLGATALGTFSANIGLFWVIGTMAKRQERAQQAELAKLQQGYLEMVEREKKRLENYARMEG